MVRASALQSVELKIVFAVILLGVQHKRYSLEKSWLCQGWLHLPH